MTKPNSSISPAAITELVNNGPHRSQVGRNQLTLALGGLYIASTTASAKPLLVWEAEGGYARYYIPTESLHTDIKRRLSGSDSGQVEASGHGDSGPNVDVVEVDSVTGENNKPYAVVERLTVGSKSTTWVRFVEGPTKGFIRFERSEIGWFTLALSPFPFLHGTLRLLTLRRPQTTGSKMAASLLALRTPTSGSILQLSPTISLSKLMVRKSRKQMLLFCSMRRG